MEIKKVNEGILFFYVEAEKFPYGSVALLNQKKAAVFDTMDCVANAKQVRDYLEELGVKHFVVVNTHWHWHHIAGNSLYLDSATISSSSTRERIAENKGALGKAEGYLGQFNTFPIVYPNITFPNRLELYLEDLKIELFTIVIHTIDHIIGYLPQEKVLIAGDTLEAPLPLIVEVEDLPGHIENLRKLRELDIETIVPAHGNKDCYEMGGYDRSLIDANIDYLSKLLNRVDDKNFLEGSMEEYVSKVVEPRESYRAVHQANLESVYQHYKK